MPPLTHVAVAVVVEGMGGTLLQRSPPAQQGFAEPCPPDGLAPWTPFPFLFLSPVSLLRCSTKPNPTVPPSSHVLGLRAVQVPQPPPTRTLRPTWRAGPGSCRLRPDKAGLPRAPAGAAPPLHRRQLSACPGLPVPPHAVLSFTGSLYTESNSQAGIHLLPN